MKDFWSDLRWWLVFCSRRNGVSCWFPPTVVHQVVLSDASEHGIVVLIGTLPGSTYTGHLGHTTSQSHSPNYHGGSKLGSTMGRTMHPVSLWQPGLSTWYPFLSSWHGHMTHLLNCLFFFEAFYKFSLMCTYPGEVKWIGWWLISWQISLFLHKLTQKHAPVLHGLPWSVTECKLFFPTNQCLCKGPRSSGRAESLSYWIWHNQIGHFTRKRMHNGDWTVSNEIIPFVTIGCSNDQFIAGKVFSGESSNC